MTLRTACRALILAPVLALTAMTALPAAAAGEVHYSGTFSAAITASACTPQGYFDGLSASGNWRVNVQGKKAEGRFVIDLNESPHVAFTTPMTLLDPNGATFKASLQTAAGNLYVTLTGTSFEYRIGTSGDSSDNYDSTTFLGADGATCDYVAYHGVLA